MIFEYRSIEHAPREFLALESEDDVQLYEISGQILAVRQDKNSDSDKIMLELLKNSQSAKKISFQKLEERENSAPKIIQTGSLKEIQDLVDENPQGIWVSTLVYCNCLLFKQSIVDCIVYPRIVVNKLTRFGRFCTHSLLYIATSSQRR